MVFLHTLRWNCVTATDPRLIARELPLSRKVDYLVVVAPPRFVARGGPPFEPAGC